jgi:Putative auto-transporter adhesin, head GIN domain
MKQLFTIVALFFSMLVVAQTKLTRTTGDFNGISSATGIIAVIKQGTENEVIVSASKDELVNNIKTEVDENGVLKIYYKNPNKVSWNANKNVKLNAYVTYKSINSLSASSGSFMESDMPVHADDLKIEVSSGAEMELDIETKDCSINVSSGANAKIGGNATNTKIIASSGSYLKAEKLTTENCTASASSGAEIKIEITKKLNASASSGGAIRYKGNPTIESKKLSSGGEVKALNN